MSSDEDDGEVLTGGKLWGGQQRKHQWLPAKKPEAPAATEDHHPAALQLNEHHTHQHGIRPIPTCWT